MNKEKQMTNSEARRQAAIEVIESTAAKYKASFICRDEIHMFTGGTLAPGSIANLDSKKLGPEGSFYLGRKKCYPISSLVKFLINRLEV